MSDTADHELSIDTTALSRTDALELWVDGVLRGAPTPGQCLDWLFHAVATDQGSLTVLLRGRYATGPNPHQWRHDIEAINAFLAAYRNTESTRRRYRLELERLLLWSLVRAGKTISDLTHEDARHYREFLAAPPPPAPDEDDEGHEYPGGSRHNMGKDHWWCGKRRPRFVVGKSGLREPNPAWRPFTNEGMSARTRGLVLDVAHTFISYAMLEGYMVANVFHTRGRHHEGSRLNQSVLDPARGYLGEMDRGPDLIKAAPSSPEKKADSAESAGTVYHIETVLTPKAWACVRRYIETRPHGPGATVAEDSFYHQVRFNVFGMYATGARIHEWASHRMDSLDLEHGRRLFWVVKGKGAKEPSRVPVLEWFLPVLYEYRAHLELPREPVPGEAVRLALRRGAGRVDSDPDGEYSRRSISVRQLYNLITRVFKEAAKQASDPQVEAQLCKATPHWLRHSVVTHLMESGKLAPQDIQLFARHQDINTTMHYSHKELDEFHDRVAGTGVGGPG